MTNTLNNRAICILGMHRSGTSAVTRAFNLLGVYIGESEQIVPPHDDNPKGFWEHKGIIDIHERILNSLSCNWYDIWPLEQEWWELQEIKEIKEDLINLLLQDFAEKPLWGWKDPRTCLTLPLWHEISEQLNFDIRFPIVLRNPIDIANSSMKRNNFPLNKSYLLWQLYTLSALEGTKNTKRCIVSYDDFLNNWESSLLKVTKALDLPWTSDTNNLKQEMESFLEKGLRHSQSSLGDLNSKVRNLELPKSISSLYELCLRAEQEQGFINSDEFNSKIHNMYLEHVTFTQMVNSEFKKSIEYKDQSINNKIKQITNLDAHIQQLQIHNNNKDLVIQEKENEIKRTIEDKNKVILSITNTLSWKITKPLRWFGRFLSNKLSE